MSIVTAGHGSTNDLTCTQLIDGPAIHAESSLKGGRGGFNQITPPQ